MILCNGVPNKCVCDACDEIIQQLRRAGLPVETGTAFRRRQIAEATARDFESGRRRPLSDTNEKRPSTGAQCSTALDDSRADESNGRLSK